MEENEYMTLEEYINLSKEGIEIWKALPNYEGIYEVSNLGQIRSLTREVIYSNGRKHIHHGKILKFSDHEYGYYLVTLCNYNQIQLPIHVLVLQTFYGPAPEGYLCRHLDGNPQNNRLYNLIWGTHKENYADMVKHERRYNQQGENGPQAKLNNDQIKIIKEKLRKGARRIDLAKKFNVNSNTIGDIKMGRTWKHII